MRLMAIFALLLLAGCATLRATDDPVLLLKEIHPFGATALAYNDNGGLLATGGLHGEVRIWRMPEGVVIARLSGAQETVRGLAWMDDNRLLSVTQDGTLTLWDIETRRAIRQVTTSPINAVTGVPGSPYIITAHRDGYLRVFRAPELERMTERRLESGARALAANRDGTRLAVATRDRQVVLVDMNLRNVQTLARPPYAVKSLRFSPDGRQLAAGAWFKLMFWDLTGGQLSVRDSEHVGAIISIDYTPDGKNLVSLGRIIDSSLYLTEVASGSVLKRFAPMPLCGWMTRVSPDGRYIAAGSEDGSVHIYAIASSGP